MQIGQFNQPLHPAAGAASARQADDQRHAQNVIIMQRRLADQAAAAGELAMVRGKDDEGVVKLTAFPQRMEQFPNAVVNQADGGRIMAHHGAFPRLGPAIHLVPGLRHPLRKQAALLLRGCGGNLELGRVKSQSAPAALRKDDGAR